MLTVRGVSPRPLVSLWLFWVLASHQQTRQEKRKIAKEKEKKRKKLNKKTDRRSRFVSTSTFDSFLGVR